MRYCCTVFQRVGTCYHEFRKGSFRQGSSHWSSDSLLLHDNILQRSGFGKILQETLPAYNQYGITVVNWTQWQCILQHALAQGGGAELVALEVNEWAEDTFRDHAVFTILGDLKGETDHATQKDHSHSACRSGGGILRDKRSGFEAAAEGDQPTFLASLLYFGAGIGIGLLYCINPKSHRGEKKTDTQKTCPIPSA